MRGKATQREPGHAARAVAFPPLRNFPNPRENTSNAGDVLRVESLPAACDPRTELNLFSGLSHVAADTLRSLTQVVVGAVILAGGPSETVDAYGTLVISVIILLGAAFLLYEVGLQFRDGLSG